MPDAVGTVSRITSVQYASLENMLIVLTVSGPQFSYVSDYRRSVTSFPPAEPGWGGAGQLAYQGLSRDTLKAGDIVVITGTRAAIPPTSESAWSPSGVQRTALNEASVLAKP